MTGPLPSSLRAPLAACALALLACTSEPETGDATGTETGETGDGDGDPETGDGDGEPETGDGDGEPAPDPTPCGSMSSDDCPWQLSDLPSLLPQACGFEQPCETLTILYPFGADAPTFSETAFTCVVEALRDGQPGQYRVHFDHEDFGEYEIFEVLPERRAQWANWSPGDTGECDWDWATRSLLDADAYQACLDAIADPTEAVDCFEAIWSEAPSCFPIEEIDCGF